MTALWSESREAGGCDGPMREKREGGLAASVKPSSEWPASSDGGPWPGQRGASEAAC
jgi:hypothetical protein